MVPRNFRGFADAHFSLIFWSWLEEKLRQEWDFPGSISSFKQVYAEADTEEKHEPQAWCWYLTDATCACLGKQLLSTVQYTEKQVSLSPLWPD